MPEPICLDLDGTLIDSVPGITTSLRHALAVVGVSTRFEDWRPLIGPPVAQMVAAALPELDDVLVQRIVRRFREHYDAEGCVDSVAWPGVAETLHVLHRRGHPLFIITNKPAIPTHRILDANGWSGITSAVVASDAPYAGTQSKADRAFRMAADHHLAGGVFVGDGLEDAEAAGRIGARFLLASWGYGIDRVRQAHPDCLLLETFAQLSEFLS